MSSQITETGQQTRSLKKRYGVVAALALVAALSVGGTLASTTVQAAADNVMTFGDVKTQVIQSELTEDGQYVDLEPEQYDIEAPMGKVNRRVRVKNIGGQSQYIRVRLSMQAGTAGSDDLQDASDYVNYGLNSADGLWISEVDDKTGITWYYYTQPVAEGEETSNLVESMELVGNYNSLVGEGGRLVFTAHAEAVQSEHNETADWPDKGWPSDDSTGGNALTTTDTTNDEERE